MRAPHSLECTKKSANNFLLELPKHPKTALQTLQQCACSYSMRTECSAFVVEELLEFCAHLLGRQRQQEMRGEPGEERQATCESSSWLQCLKIVRIVFN